jgi:hypothetical protein
MHGSKLRQFNYNFRKIMYIWYTYKMLLKPIKKLLFYSLFSFFFSISFSQEIAIYNFENLNLGVITGQDGWEFSTSLATTNTGYNCPVIGTPIAPQIVSMPTEGDYSSGRAIRSGDGWGNQHLILNGIIQIESTKEIKIISILSLRGKLVVKSESFSNRVDISNLKNGIYIIELLNTDSSKEHHQIIKN